MLKTAESTAVAAEHLQLIDRVAGQIAPDDKGLVEWYRTYRREHTRRLAGDLAIVTRLVDRSARLLEYGAVPLLMTAALSALGYRTSAVDLAPERFAGAIAALGLDVRRCDVEREAVPFDDQAFDVVLFNELFEHLRINPILTMREVRRVLKPGGRLILSTPNLRSFRGLRNLVLRDRGHAVSPGGYRQYAKLETLGHMGHVREYTATEVVEFLGKIGLQSGTLIFRGGHGSGLAGIAERLLPAWRPFFTVVATRPLAERR